MRATRRAGHHKLPPGGDDGEIRHIRLSGRPVFDAAGRFRGYRGTARNVTSEVVIEIELERRVEERTTELHTVQEELLRKERLATLGQLTATVSHELRNPLGAIRNTSSPSPKPSRPAAPGLSAPSLDRA
jgi:signal transduction histidine kinase